MNLINPEGLIGDFLGTVPLMQQLAKKEELVVELNPDALPITEIIHMDNINIVPCGTFDPYETTKLDIQSAFRYAYAKGEYMSQTYFRQVGLETPRIPPKAVMNVTELQGEHRKIDFVIAPFSRSLPPEQRWSIGDWRELCSLMPEYTFLFIGTQADAEEGSATQPNTFGAWGRKLNTVCNILQKSKYGLISVVSGPSHLAFHLGIRNFLLSNQDSKWGNNPDAIRLSEKIPTLKPETVKKFILKYI